MNKSNWDDFRYILAVAESGSLNATAKKLGVTHVTVMRRIAAFEERYGQQIFHKSPSGYQPLPEADKILEVARNVEDAVLSVERTIFGAQSSLTGTVRIASTDSVCEVLLPKAIKALSRTFPALSVTVLSANSYHDLARLTADIAIRPALKLNEELSGDLAGMITFKGYTAEDGDDGWLGLTGSLSRSVAAAWVSENIPEHQIRHSADSFMALSEMAAKGLGKAILPSFLGDGDTRLVPLDPNVSLRSVPLWVASQKEMYRNPRFTAVRNVLVSEFGKMLPGQ